MENEERYEVILDGNNSFFKDNKYDERETFENVELKNVIKPRLTSVDHIKQEFDSDSCTSIDERENEDTKDLSEQFTGQDRKFWNKSDGISIENCISSSVKNEMDEETHYEINGDSFKFSICNFKTEITCHMEEVDSKLNENKSLLYNYITTGQNNLKNFIDGHLIGDNLKSDTSLNSGGEPTTNTNGVKKPLDCDFCDYSTLKKCNLKVHTDTVHLKIKALKCDFCDYRTNLKHRLNVHVNSVHLKLKKHKCNMCDYSGIRKRDLRVHTNDVHLKIKNYKCHYCDYSTNLKNDLKVHKDGVHTRMKNHNCHLCDYSTNFDRRLKIHVDGVHLNLKNFKCHVCDFSTARKGNLKRHICRVHPNAACDTNQSCDL